MSELKFCKDCRHYPNDPKTGSFQCQSLNVQKSQWPHTGEFYTAVEVFHCRADLLLCGPEAKWFEPKAPDPGEGWRLLYQEEIRVDDKWKYGTCEWMSVLHDWVGHNSHAQEHLALGRIFRRRIEPELERCPDGHEAHIRKDMELYRVFCEQIACWVGPTKQTPMEAGTTWNSVMRAYCAQRKRDFEVAHQVIESVKNNP